MQFFIGDLYVRVGRGVGQRTKLFKLLLDVLRSFRTLSYVHVLRNALVQNKDHFAIELDSQALEERNSGQYIGLLKAICKSVLVFSHEHVRGAGGGWLWNHHVHWEAQETGVCITNVKDVFTCQRISKKMFNLPFCKQLTSTVLSRAPRSWARSRQCFIKTLYQKNWSKLWALMSCNLSFFILRSSGDSDGAVQHVLSGLKRGGNVDLDVTREDEILLFSAITWSGVYHGHFNLLNHRKIAFSFICYISESRTFSVLPGDSTSDLSARNCSLIPKLWRREEWQKRHGCVGRTPQHVQFQAQPWSFVDKHDHAAA